MLCLDSNIILENQKLKMLLVHRMDRLCFNCSHYLYIIHEESYMKLFVFKYIHLTSREKFLIHNERE